MTTVPALLQHRPAVHQLCIGAFIQETLHLRSNVAAVPLQPLGFDSEAHYAGRYANEVVGAQVDNESLEALKSEGRQAGPIVAIVVQHKIDAPPELLDKTANPLLRHARTVLGWVAGNTVVPFAMVTATTDNTFFRIIPPHARQRQRLGFGNTGAEYQALLGRIMTSAEEDEHFAFALSMFHDALREDNPEFRVARFFACLESLAHRLKKDRGSRAAVRYLIGLEAGATCRFSHDGKNYSYDRVEIAGRIRDKLFHGVPFDPDELNDDSRSAYEWLAENPKEFGDMLLTDCELEIARWANGASRGLAP